MKRCEAPDCVVEFEPARSTAKYCSATCRQRANRARKAADESVEADAEKGKAEHALVRAVRLELEQAGKDQTFNGQLALQLARRLTDVGEKGPTALSKELREVMAVALAGQAPEPEESLPDPEPEDEVTRAREARERKAREAAAR